MHKISWSHALGKAGANDYKIDHVTVMLIRYVVIS